MGIGDFLGDIGNGIKHGLDKTVEGLNVVDRYINPFHEEQTITPEGKAAADAATAAGQATTRGVLAPGLEDVMEGYRWLWSNGVSQPIATAALVGKLGRRSNSDPLGFDKDYFSTANWVKSWHAANHISPGQALAMDPDEAKRAIESPLLYYKPPEAYLPPDFGKLPEAQQQEILKDAGMPAIGNAYIEKQRGESAWFKYGTGSLDFAALTFLDPTVVAGKVIAETRLVTVGKKAPKGGWSQATIDQMVSNSQMRKLMDGIWANKDNPQLINNTTLAQRSGMGPRFGSIVSQLNDPEELELFVRTGMGDMRAVEELKTRNSLIAARMNNVTARTAALDLMRARYANMPQMQRLVDHEMTRLEGLKNADATLMNRYSSILDSEALLDQLHVSRWSMARAQDRTAAQNVYRAGPARGARRTVSIQPTVGPVQVGNVGFGLGHATTPRAPIGSYVHTRLEGAGDYFSGPVTLIRSLKNMHPNGYMRIDTIDKDSVNELRGHLARIPGIRPETRQTILNNYLQTTTEAERLGILDDVGRLGAAKVAEKHGLSLEDGEAFYRKHQELRLGELDNMKRYSAAIRSPEEVAAGQPLHIDEFTTEGNKVSLSPFTVTRLVNGHTFQDLDELDKVLARHGSRFETLRVAAGNARDAMEGFADYSSYLWKFSTLFRLGYVPRILGDDLASQWAAVGTAAMALRTTRGVMNAFENGARWLARPALKAREENALNGVQYAADEMALLEPGMGRLTAQTRAEELGRQTALRRATARHAAAQQRLASLEASDVTPKAQAVRQFAAQREREFSAARLSASLPASNARTRALEDLTRRHEFLGRYRDLSQRAAGDYAAQQKKVTQGGQTVVIDGRVFPAAFGGKSGDYHRALISSDESVGNIFATNKQLMQGNLERSFDHGGQVISAAQDEAKHATAWAHVINNQIMQDQVQKMIVSGRMQAPEQAAEWMKNTASGIAYRRRLPKLLDTDDIAKSQFYEVDQYLHTPEIRMKALEEGGVTPAWLREATPSIVDRPDIHTGRVGNSQLAHAHALDRVIEKFYKVAAAIPSDRMSRHPLFNQFYEGHVKRMVSQRKSAGADVSRMSVEDVEQLAHNARKLALRDTRNLVFDIAHRSDAAAAMRFLSPFFSATAESFQRWGRVIADKPQTVGYGGRFFNAPLANGAVQDMDGNKVNQDGYTYIPVYPLNADGTVNYDAKPRVVKRMVPKSERYIVMRVPKWLAESPAGAALNITSANGKLMLSQNSINMVTQGDPWFSPGVGPIVQIPVNEFVRDKPRAAEFAREVGILPFGPSGGNVIERVAGATLPNTLRNFLTAYDTSDNRYQSIKLQIMQREIFDWTQAHGGRRPSEAQIGKMQQSVSDKARKYWLFAGVSAFVQPMATLRKDPYQFYRDQYNALRRNNPLTADDEFLERYGESYFVFAQETSRSQGVAPTMQAVGLAQKYSKEIAQNPELAALIIGPEGNGPYSPEAYTYELNHPLTPGGAEMMRSKMGADEALKENQRRLGWAKYTKKMNELNANMRSAGFTSFEDDGAESFKDDKKAWTSLYAEPLYPDGTPNPYYNAEWSKDFFTQDQRKYERLIPGLLKIARSNLADQPGRSDLRMLQQYLGGRQALVSQLSDLKSNGLPHTLAAGVNADLRKQWIMFVDGLVESDTRFGDLYHRYLSRDMGVDVEEESRGTQG